jgi:putative phosphoesterase
VARAAVLYDVHGNRDALEAALAAADGEGYDVLVLGGDYALFGPEPAEVVDRLRALRGPVLAIRGNTDRVLYDALRPPAWGQWPPETVDWYRERLGEERLAWLAGLPFAVAVEGHDALAVHATPQSDEALLRADTPDAEVAAMLADVPQHLLLCGHVHVQYRRRVGAVEVVNPGSVGFPFDGQPGAAWALVEDGEVALRRAPYDAEAVARRLEASDNPSRALGARRLRERAS